MPALFLTAPDHACKRCGREVWIVERIMYSAHHTGHSTTWWRCSACNETVLCSGAVLDQPTSPQPQPEPSKEN